MTTLVKQINLIPTGTRFLIRWTPRKVAVVTLLVLVAGLASVHLLQLRSIGDHRRMISDAEARLSALTGQNQEMLDMIGSGGAISQRRSDLEHIRTIVGDYMSGRIVWSGVIGDMTKNIADDVWLDRIEVFDETEKTKGKAVRTIKRMEIDGRTLSSEGIATFIGYMEGYPLFSAVVLSSGERVRYGNRYLYRFKASCEVGR